MQIPWRKLVGWYHGALLMALPWVALWRPGWGPVVAAAALALHLPASRDRRAEPWAGSAIAVSALVFVVLKGGWELALFVQPAWLKLSELASPPRVPLRQARPRRG